MFALYGRCSGCCWDIRAVHTDVVCTPVKRFLNNRSNRQGYDGWALRIIGAPHPLCRSTCTTRQEARELKHDMQKDPDLFQKIEIVKVKINLEAVA